MHSRATAASALIGVGGVLVAVAGFLPWFRFSGRVDVDLFKLLRVAGMSDAWVWGAVVFGAAVGLVGFCLISPRTEDLRALGFTALVVVGLAGGVGLVRVVHAMPSTDGLVGFGPGVVLAGTAEALFLVAVVLAFAARRSTDVAADEAQTGATTLWPVRGWYADPDSPAHVRWWDGTGWTEYTSAFWSLSLADQTQDPSSAAGAITESPRGGDGERRRRPSRRWAILLVVALFVASGGGYLAVDRLGLTAAGHPAGGRSPSRGVVPAGSTSPPVPPLGMGYLATGTTFADFLQWNDHNGELTGAAQAATSNGQAPALVLASEMLTLSGTLEGSSISMSLDQGPQTLGTLSGDSFTLAFPQPDGTLAPVTFSAASMQQYNSAVAGLRQRIDQANNAAVTAEMVTQQQQKIGTDAATVSGDIASLSQAEGTLDGDVLSLPSSLNAEANDLVTTHQAELAVVASAAQASRSAGGGCTNPNGVADNADRVGPDLARAGAAVNSVGNDVAQVRGLLFALDGAAGQLATDEAALPGYSPPTPPSPQNIDQAVATANADVGASLSKTNGSVDTANADAAAAVQDAAHAAQVGSCGWSPAPVSPLVHLS